MIRRSLLRTTLTGLLISTIFVASPRAQEPGEIFRVGNPALGERIADDDPPDPELADPSAPPDPTADAADRFRWFGEALGYTVSILGDEVARTGFSVGYPIEADGHGRVIPIEGGAYSTNFFAMVYPMNDTALTFIDPQTGLPIWTTKTIDERNQARTYEVSFEREVYRAEVERQRDGRTDRYARLGPSDLHDALSWILDLRSRDLSIGQSYVYYIYDGWKMIRLTVRVTRHTDVYTGLGFVRSAEMSFTREVLSSAPPLPWADSGFLIPPVYAVTDGPQDLGVGWFSLDERQLPVGTEIETPIGHLRVILDTWAPPGSVADAAAPAQ